MKLIDTRSPRDREPAPPGYRFGMQITDAIGHKEAKRYAAKILGCDPTDVLLVRGHESPERAGWDGTDEWVKRETGWTAYVRAK